MDDKLTDLFIYIIYQGSIADITVVAKLNQSRILRDGAFCACVRPVRRILFFRKHTNSTKIVGSPELKGRLSLHKQINIPLRSGSPYQLLHITTNIHGAQRLFITAKKRRILPVQLISTPSACPYPGEAE
ncbi:MAG: hypothetical protein KIT80_20740 [Chitinophagaceae bacterium]|nr:hypothetical protein [Chitinophagaceae bacterium]MCW5929360.1 hypothetical protein [Chitinophagaceae bacterium]